MSEAPAQPESDDAPFVLPNLPARPIEGHKGTFGTVLIIGGCDAEGSVMIGAPALVARATLRTGCGLAQMAVPASILKEAITIEPCATGIALPQKDSGRIRPSDSAELLDGFKSRASVIALGPGLGTGIEQQQLMIRLLAEDETPIVVDADGLNNLAQIAQFGRDLRAPLVLTPHPGEFARLADAIGMDEPNRGKGDDAERAAAAGELARRLGCVVILKGAGTVVSDGQRTWTCDIREPALATGGSGDVLTGIVASIIAQFFRPHKGAGRVTPKMQGGLDLMECAAVAVDIHAKCARVWSERNGGIHAGMIASDLCPLIPEVVGLMREREAGA